MRSLLLALLAASLGLAACGGSSGQAGSSSIATAPGGSPPSSSAQAGLPKRATTTRSARPAPPRDSAGSPEAKRAGRAAPFVKPGADNSIPTYGSEASASQQSRAEAALRAYLTARARGEWAAACRGLAASARQGIERLAGTAKKGCAPIYKALSGRAPASTRVSPLTGPLLSLRVKGAQGFALFYGPHRQQYVMPMAREGGAWKVTQLAPIAYPLGSTPAAP